MLAVIGLGNPGASYEKTRHNVGFMLLDGILEGRFIDTVSFPPKGFDVSRRFFRSKAAFKKSRGPFVIIEAEIEGKRFCLIKPTTFMNESGRTLTSLRTRGIIKDVSELLVVVDDIELDVGRIRLRAKGSAGGHNGLKSVINHLGTDEFSRLRIGVGPRPIGDEMVDYVLSVFKPEELGKINTSLEKAACVIEAWITGGFERAQNVLARL